MVEQWTHKPLVVGSNPTLATNEPAIPAGFFILQVEQCSLLP